MGHHRLLITLCLLSLFTGQLLAQTTESEAALQRQFIEANREKLLGNHDKAIALYRQILKDDGDNAAVAFELGRLYQAKEDLQESLRYLVMATQLDPSNNWYAIFLAEAYHLGGRYQESAQIYANLVQQSPSDIDLYYKWALMLVKAQEISQAIKVYDQLEARTGFNEEIARRRHTLFMGTGDTKRAARELERLVETFPRNLDYRHLLASFYESRGDQASARRTYEGILSIKPDDAKAQLALAGQPSAKQDEVRYLASLEPLFAREDVALDQKMGTLLPVIKEVAETGNRELADAALKLTTILERVHPTQAKPLAASADLLFYSGRSAEALEKYRATLVLDKNVFPVWEQFFALLYDRAEMTELYQKSNQALDLFPNKASAYYYFALAAESLHKYEEALDALSQSALMTGRDDQLKGEIKALAGQIYLIKGQTESAVNYFAEARRLAPQSAEVNRRYALLLQEQGQLREARALAESVSGSQPNNFYYMETWARILFKQGDYPAARAKMDQALARGASRWVLGLELYGDILYQLKDTEGAVGYWAQAREQGGNWPNLLKKIANRQWYE